MGNVPGDGRGEHDGRPVTRGEGGGGGGDTGGLTAPPRGAFMVVPTDGSAIGILSSRQFAGYQLAEGRYQG